MDSGKIGIYGDSYGVWMESDDMLNPGEKSYPKLIAKNLNLEIVKHSRPSTSIWWSYQQFLKSYHKYKFIIFVYSQHNRWHHLSEEAHGMHNLTVRRSYVDVPNPDKERKRISEILYNAYRYVNSEELDCFIFQHVFNSINQICKNNNIGLLNILPFEDGSMYINYDNRTGSCIYNLNNLADYEKSGLSKPEAEAFFRMVCDNDRRDCHLSDYHNDLVSSVCLQALDQNLPMIDIMEDDRISNNPEHNYHLYTDYLNEIHK